MHRLNTKDISNVISKGKGYSSNTLYLKVLKNNKDNTRSGVAVGKKLAKKATQRNYYKRVLRHILKEVLTDTSTPYDMVLIAKEDIKNKNFKELKKDAEGLLQKAGVK